MTQRSRTFSIRKNWFYYINRKTTKLSVNTPEFKTIIYIYIFILSWVCDRKNRTELGPNLKYS